MVGQVICDFSLSCCVMWKQGEGGRECPGLGVGVAQGCVVRIPVLWLTRSPVLKGSGEQGPPIQDLQEECQQDEMRWGEGRRRRQGAVSRGGRALTDGLSALSRCKRAADLRHQSGRKVEGHSLGLFHLDNSLSCLHVPHWEPWLQRRSKSSP